MKIALVAPYDYPYPGGVTERISALYDCFHRLGHEFKIITACSDDEENVPDHVIKVSGFIAPVPFSGLVAWISLAPIIYSEWVGRDRLGPLPARGMGWRSGFWISKVSCWRGKVGEHSPKLTPTELARRSMRWLLEPLACLINRTGISPNLLTVIGFVFTAGVAYVLATGHLQIGGVLLAVAGTFDALDGTLARLAGRKSRFGAFLDSIVDRLSEAVIFLGLFIHYTQHGGQQESFLIYATIVGSLMVSYVRARAEGIGIECKRGILTRFERAVVLVVSLILDQMLIALWIMAVLSNFTALQRMYHVWRATGGEEGG